MTKKTSPNLTWFHSSSGEMVLFQAPNLPLYLAFGWYVFRWLPLPLAPSLSHWGVTLLMLYWSAWEITTGINYWRRGLGLAAGVYFGWQLLALLH